jgi:hypothetical protein
MSMSDDNQGESVADLVADELQRHSDTMSQLMEQAGMIAGDDNEDDENA